MLGNIDGPFLHHHSFSTSALVSSTQMSIMSLLDSEGFVKALINNYKSLTYWPFSQTRFTEK